MSVRLIKGPGEDKAHACRAAQSENKVFCFSVLSQWHELLTSLGNTRKLKATESEKKETTKTSYIKLRRNWGWGGGERQTDKQRLVV